MFCEKCGYELKEGAIFCSMCGERVQSDQAMVKSHPELTEARKGKSPWTILFIIMVLALLASGSIFLIVTHQNTVNKEAQEAAKIAVNGVGKINAAISVGVTYQNYMGLLSEAAAADEAYQPKDKRGNLIHVALALAINYYSIAGKAWGEDIRNKFKGDSYKFEPGLGLSDDGYISADEVRQAAWKAAGAAYENARSLLGEYNN